MGGAKSYSYKTKYGCTKKGKVQVKQKGITLDMANDEVVNFDTMRDMVLNTTEKDVAIVAIKRCGDMAIVAIKRCGDSRHEKVWRDSPQCRAHVMRMCMHDFSATIVLNTCVASQLCLWHAHKSTHTLTINGRPQKMDSDIQSGHRGEDTDMREGGFPNLGHDHALPRIPHS